MGFNFNFSWGSPQQPLSVEHDSSGNWFYRIFSSDTKKGKLNDKTKLELVLNNPAALKVFALNCDLFSLGKINSYRNDKLDQVNFIYSLKQTPNDFQTWKQFFWDYMFWRMTGTAIMYSSSNVLNEKTQIYWLKPYCLEIPKSVSDKLSKNYNSNETLKSLSKEKVKYTFDDGTTTYYQLSELSFFFDLSNGLQGNWITGNSRLDALYQIICNSQKAIDSKGVNLDFSKKFVITGNYDPTKNLSDFSTMGNVEKEDIEQKVLSGKPVHSVKMPIDLKRFVDDIARLKLDESFYNDYFMIGSMYGIPRDVLEANLRGSTYENQEKATGRHIEYSIKPAADDFTDRLEKVFGFEDVRIEYTHLSFNQIFEQQKAEKQKIQLENVKLAKELGGVTESQAVEMVNQILQ